MIFQWIDAEALLVYAAAEDIKAWVLETYGPPF